MMVYIYVFGVLVFWAGFILTASYVAWIFLQVLQAWSHEVEISTEYKYLTIGLLLLLTGYVLIHIANLHAGG